MLMTNNIRLMGRLVNNPTLSVKGKTSFTNFTLAVDMGNGTTNFFQIAAFKKLAENLAKYTEKGNRIIVYGFIRNNNYEKDGQMVYQNQIVASSLYFVDFAINKEESPNGGNTLENVEDFPF